MFHVSNGWNNRFLWHSVSPFLFLMIILGEPIPIPPLLHAPSLFYTDHLESTFPCWVKSFCPAVSTAGFVCPTGYVGMLTFICVPTAWVDRCSQGEKKYSANPCIILGSPLCSRSFLGVWSLKSCPEAGPDSDSSPCQWCDPGRAGELLWDLMLHP